MTRAGLVLTTAIAVVACRGGSSTPPIVQPGAPGQSARVVTAQKAADLSGVQPTAADVTFMQGMIHHHAQAIDMVNLLKTRTASEEMRKLGLRIELSQDDEIKMMRRWLEARGQEAPAEHAHHLPGAPRMPGMLTTEELARLEAAQGVPFDRLFLEFMIKHHLGAIVMVDELLASPRAAQDSDIFAFASDVVADQRAEIDRMGAMLARMRGLARAREPRERQP